LSTSRCILICWKAWGSVEIGLNWCILDTKKMMHIQSNVLKSGRIGKNSDLSDHDRYQHISCRSVQKYSHFSDEVYSGQQFWWRLILTHLRWSQQTRFSLGVITHVDTMLHCVCRFLSPNHHFVCVYMCSSPAQPSPLVYDNHLTNLCNWHAYMVTHQKSAEKLQWKLLIKGHYVHHLFRCSCQTWIWVTLCSENSGVNVTPDIQSRFTFQWCQLCPVWVTG